MDDNDDAIRALVDNLSGELAAGIDAEIMTSLVGLPGRSYLRGTTTGRMCGPIDNYSNVPRAFGRVFGMDLAAVEERVAASTMTISRRQVVEDASKTALEIQNGIDILNRELYRSLETALQNLAAARQQHDVLSKEKESWLAKLYSERKKVVVVQIRAPRCENE